MRANIRSAEIQQRFLAASGPQMGSIGPILRHFAMLNSKTKVVPQRGWCDPLENIDLQGHDMVRAWKRSAIP